MERVGDGVWVLRLRPPSRVQKLTNVYLLQDGERVTLFDSGSRQQAPGIAQAAAQHGGIERILLSHAHSDHRGGASELDAPVLCHPDERSDVEGDGGEHYFDWSKVRNPAIRALGPGTGRRMDGGPLQVADTVAEGDTVAGFEVVHLPGHAPGLIGLWRDSDRLAIVSDAVFVFSPFSMLALPGQPRIAHAAVRPDDVAARESVRRVAALNPREVWIGHYGPVTGDVRGQLEQAAEGA
jgi:hydroxyacylglutathione hydrolase